MENSGSSSILRNRSFLNTSSGPTAEGASKILEKDVGQKLRRLEVDVNEDGFGSKLISCVRIVTCFVTMMVTTLIWALIMLVLLPWPYERIRQGNVYGHVTGRLMMRILGNPVQIEGAEFANKRAIFISNHASPLDIFPIMWLTPTGTVGIAKKEVIWYPLFGQLYVLANHLRIDRSNPTAAIESLKEAAQAVVRKKLSLIIFPEGTRSADGRLLPFKKGFIHLALQTRLPIVPIVLIGTHRAWRKGSLRVRPTPLTIKYLSPISTDDWTADKIDEYIRMLHDLYVQHLPDSQRPLALAESTNGTKS
ncbi:1-acyl-sn-glycerol-3-phosphate acyltransferase isoform X2 [Rosa chinensis]|nr:1-acyl-sn-glycerol-3-phosphate acyltransferase isoform X2 [Rosa chinensis]XP_024159752.1 1-acyl-sn-glycerol-3-phosphate acyltransferase isoform X2 [Rosa chinensis]XP_024159753.1 1-acyl-sn-glycerol-3-phosphate acyltransferase isoform X2 [Rosa chinensis]